MREKPILFNTNMVRAILDGRKRCTRRVVKGYIPEDAQFGYTGFTPNGAISCRGIFKTSRPGYGEKFFKLPYQPGDILYVRETWYKGAERYMYRADYSDTERFYRGGEEIEIKWHPSIHMPKAAARIWIKVTDVRVERLQEITTAGTLLEGVSPSSCRECNAPFGCDMCPDEGYSEIDSFIEIWNGTLKKSDLDRYGWDANPWVWVIEFDRCKKPEKEM